jgi:Glu-tRNA(Gln) amidotransferase subunit E-like FAD-binding protein
MTSQEIIEWISENVTLADFNPKMKAMGNIMKSLKGKADGNMIKTILEG